MAYKKNRRPIDEMTNESYSWLKRSWIFVKKTELHWWQSAVILAFFVGLFVAVIMIVRVRLETNSAASLPQATMSVSSSNTSVTVGDNVSANVLLNTNSGNVVAATAIVTFKPDELQFVSYNTDNSVFTANNSCVVNGKACQIVQDDTANGKITITMAKPSPGVNTTSGVFATLNFKALKATTSSIALSFAGAGSLTDSNVILDDSKGTEILASVANVKIAIAAPTCTSFVYSSWGTCANNSQSRTVTSNTPAGCAGGNPILTQSCQSPTCSSFTYSSWSTCTNGTQTRTITASSPTGCVNGSPVLSQNCTAPTCTSFTYSAWSTCTNGTQTRTVSSSSPSGCTGGSPVLSQSCSSTTTTSSDTVAPTANLATPYQNYLFSKTNTLAIVVTASDNVKVTNIDVFLDDKVVKSCPKTTSCTARVYGGTMSAGNHSVYGKASDAAGNVGQTKTVTVIRK